MSSPNSTINYVTSRDGTTIGFDRLGDGPPVILVSGGSVDRQSLAGIAALLSSDFTAFNYDRRGRGDSGDTLPYAVEREIEDIDAVVAAAGGSANLFGTSSGAALALAAAERLKGKITRLALWEPPFILNEEARPPAETAKIYEDFVKAGRRGDAVEYFMAKVVGMPAELVAFARTQPFWADSEKIAHTLAYDATVMADYSLPLERAAAVTTPTLVLAGGADFPFMIETGPALAAAIPGGKYHWLEGQGHNVAAEAVTPVLKEFFAG